MEVLDITYYLGNMKTPIRHPNFNDEMKARVIAAAFDAWNKILGIFRFTRVFDPTQADIEFSVGHDPAFNDGPFRETYAVCKYNDDIGKRGARIPIIFNREKSLARPRLFRRVIRTRCRKPHRHGARGHA